jgi:hypothetical protein
VSATPKLPADMVVSAFTVTKEGAAGSPVAITITTKNQGTGTADPSTTKFYVSTNFSVDATDTPFTDVQAIPVLTPGGTATVSMTAVIPSSVQPGNYYVVAKADQHVCKKHFDRARPGRIETCCAGRCRARCDDYGRLHRHESGGGAGELVGAQSLLVDQHHGRSRRPGARPGQHR